MSDLLARNSGIQAMSPQLESRKLKRVHWLNNINIQNTELRMIYYLIFSFFKCCFNLSITEFKTFRILSVAEIKLPGPLLDLPQAFVSKIFSKLFFLCSFSSLLVLSDSSILTVPFFLLFKKNRWESKCHGLIVNHLNNVNLWCGVLDSSHVTQSRLNNLLPSYSRFERYCDIRSLESSMLLLFWILIPSLTMLVLSDTELSPRCSLRLWSVSESRGITFSTSIKERHVNINEISTTNFLLML